MPKSYSDFDIEMIFDDLWELYPSKERPSAAKKALTVALRSGAFTEQEIKNAVEVYALESRGDDYLYRFANFINDDHWKDIISVHRDVDTYIKNLKQEEAEARELIEEWNRACKKHWCKCHSPDTRIAMVKKALKDPEFNHLWRNALKIAEEIFLRRRNSTEWQSNITLSLKWFTTITSDKHTVVRLIEGEFGKPMRYVPKYHKPIRDRTPEETEQLKRDMDDIFGGMFQPTDDDEYTLE